VLITSADGPWYSRELAMCAEFIPLVLKRYPRR